MIRRNQAKSEFSGSDKVLIAEAVKSQEYKHLSVGVCVTLCLEEHLVELVFGCTLDRCFSRAFQKVARSLF